MCLPEPMEGRRRCGPGVKGHCESPSECGKWDLGPLQEHKVLLAVSISPGAVYFSTASVPQLDSPGAVHPGPWELSCVVGIPLHSGY